MKTRNARFAAALAAALAVVPRAHADRAADPLWYVDAKSSLVQVGQTDLLVATPASNAPLNDEILALDYRLKPAYSLDVGRIGDDGEWRLAYWGYKHDSHLDVDGGPTQFFVPFGSPRFAATQYSRVSASASLQVHQLDATFRRSFLNVAGRSQLDWVFGLRGWVAQQTMRVHSFDPGTGNRDDNEALSSARGAGFTAGLAGKTKFGERLTGHASVTSGFLMGRSTVQDNDASLFPPVLTKASLSRSQSNKNFLQMEFETYLDCMLWKGASIFLGFEYKWYDDAVTRIDYTSNGGGGSANTVFTNALSFSGIEAGASYRF